MKVNKGESDLLHIIFNNLRDAKNYHVLTEQAEMLIKGGSYLDRDWSHLTSRLISATHALETLIDKVEVVDD